jgi:Zn-dependent protease
MPCSKSVFDLSAISEVYWTFQNPQASVEIMGNNTIDLLGRIALTYVPFLFALTFHEFAHGWMAAKKGDNTAIQMGRMTMNPIAHMDPIGTLLLPLMAIVGGWGIFFGWAKPVPFNPRNLKHPTADAFWIALAGPMSNVLLAFVSTVGLFVLYHFVGPAGWANATAALLKQFILVNLFLAIFNLIPLHPLDGGKILARFLPYSVNRKLEENENITGLILMALMFMGALRFLAVPVYIGTDFLLAIAMGGIS